MTLHFERKLDTCDPDDIAINFVSYILIISGTIIIVYIHLKSSVATYHQQYTYIASYNITITIAMCVTVYLSHAHVSSKILRQLAIFKTSVFSAPKSTSSYRIQSSRT